MKAQREIEEEIKEKRGRRREKKEEQKKENRTPFDPDEYIEWMINREKAPINNELFKKHLKVHEPIIMYKVLYETNDREKNSKLVDIFNSGLKDLEEEIKKMSKKERENEQPDNIVKVQRFLKLMNKINKINKINKDKA